MKIYDVSVSLHEGMPIYPGDPSFTREIASSMARGESANVSALHMGAHTGTHVDAPHHMIAGGATVDRLPLSALIGPATVLAIEDRRKITRAELERHDWAGVQRALFKTVNSGKMERLDRFVEDFVYIAEEAARFLARQKLVLVGVDYLSVDRFHSGTHPAHLALMEAGIVLIECLDLSEVPPGRYEMFCGPLKIKDGDGAPARVLLREL